jgi:rhodanese-related sulfurtransferase
MARKTVDEMSEMRSILRPMTTFRSVFPATLALLLITACGDDGAGTGPVGRADGATMDALISADAGTAEVAARDEGGVVDAAAADAALDMGAVDSAAEAANTPSQDGGGLDTSPASSDGATCAGWTKLVRLPPSEAATLMADSHPVVINVHIPYAGDIPGTNADISYLDVDAIEAFVHHDRCADLLLVCLSGHMSVLAGEELIRRGYLRVRDLDGGMMAWTAAGYSLLRDGGAGSP